MVHADQIEFLQTSTYAQEYSVSDNALFWTFETDWVDYDKNSIMAKELITKTLFWPRYSESICIPHCIVGKQQASARYNTSI